MKKKLLIMPSLVQLQVKHPHFKTVIHRKLNLRETQHFCNIVIKGNTLILIAVHADNFDFIVREVLRCPLIAQLQRNMYTDKQKQELIEQNGLLFEAEFNNEVGVTRNNNCTKVVQVCYLYFTYFVMNSSKCTKIAKKKKKTTNTLKLITFHANPLQSIFITSCGL